MRAWALTAALFLTGAPAAAQVATPSSQQQNGQQLPVGQGGLITTPSQQRGGQAGPSAPSQAPTTGVICIEEMTATFCNVPTGPNTSGYGSGGSAVSGGGAGSSSAAGSNAGSASNGGAGANTSSIPPCPDFPPANELCN